MSYITSLAGSIITGTAAFMIALGMHLPFLTKLLTPSHVPSVSSVGTSTANTSASGAHVSVTSSSGASHSGLGVSIAVNTPTSNLPSTSNATSQIGAFTAVVTCENANPVSITIKKNGAIVETIPVQASVTAAACLPVRAQDVNFDGVPDLLLATDDGSGGVTYSYWLYNARTQEFYCPANADDCSLLNPSFNASTHTVTSVDQLGAGSVETKTYTAENGVLVLTSDVSS